MPFKKGMQHKFYLPQTATNILFKRLLKTI